ncbi:MAG: hypothetical protein JWP89_6135 [Schlesneria sp.]|nr:hypothetical protein [Schlesneria sp.]
MTHRLSSGQNSGAGDLGSNLPSFEIAKIVTFCLGLLRQTAAMMQLTASPMKRTLHSSHRPVYFATNHHGFHFTTEIRVDLGHHPPDAGGLHLGLDLDAVLS